MIPQEIAGGPRAPGRPIFIVAGEPSGDQIGARLMAAIRLEVPGQPIIGVGGPAMEAAGLNSLFSMADIAVMGFVPVFRRLPLLLRRIRQTARAALDADPAALVLIDSPDFCKRVARKVRAARPDLPIVIYVSPTVWAWRPGRARAMAAYTDRLLALLPFEPAAHAALGGPPTSYVGHPLMEAAERSCGEPAAQPAHDAGAPVVLLLPGSRRSEIGRLLPPFAEVARRLAHARPDVSFVMPTVPHLLSEVKAAVAGWPVQPAIICGDEAKRGAFRRARVALAASGTVTLELALARVPMVVAYKVSWLEAAIGRRIIRVNTPVLPDLILGTHDIPVFMQEFCTPDAIVAALLPLFEGLARDAQLSQFEAMERAMSVPEPPSRMAARLVLKAAAEGRAP